MLQTKADVSKDILENITLGRFIRENRVEKNQDGMKWHAFKVGKFFMKHPVHQKFIQSDVLGMIWDHVPTIPRFFVRFV